MNVSELQRPWIELQEYGKTPRDPNLKLDDGAVPWEQLGLGKERTWTPEDRELAAALKEIKTKIEIIELRQGLRFQAGSFVGHVVFSTFDLVVRPKFDRLAEEKGSKSPLATLLAYAFDLDQLKVVGKQISPQPFFTEILVHYLLEESRNILRRGPFQRYRKEHKDLAVIRGKVDLKTWLNRGGVPSEAMPCVFYHRSLDNILNQTLCAGLRRSAAIAKNPSLKSQCRYLADTFALSVTERKLNDRMLDDAFRSLNRLNAHYNNAVKLIQFLYEHSGGFISGDPLKDRFHIPGFFFDMNDLFEKVIERFLLDNLGEQGYNVLPQNTASIYSFQTNGEIGNPLTPNKPDIIVETLNKQRIVLDTKYKNIGSGEPTSQDLYQLSVYALACSDHPDVSRRARILYPVDKESQVAEREIVLHRHDKTERFCTVALKPIYMHELVDSIESDDSERKKNYARDLIGEKIS